jgi:hypothetical protein
VFPQLPLLLREQGFSTSLPARSRDFQTRVGRPAQPEPDVPTPCVLLASRAADREADELSLRLAAAGVPAFRLDSDRAPGLDLAWDPATAVLHTADGAFRPVVGWARYFTAGSVPGCGDPRLDGYSRDQWTQWARLLTGDPGTRVLDRAPAPDRISQLAQARAVGLAVPRTVVTTRPGRAAAHIPGSGDLIVKSLGEHFVEAVPGDLGGLFAHRTTRAALAGEDRVEPAPVIVQEFVEAAHELRVYAVTGEFHAFEIAAHRPDAPFVDARHVPVRPAVLPEGLRAPLTALVRTWQLDVAAFDLLMTPHGPVFLEVNAACDWLWLERAAGAAPVTAAVLALLLDAYRDTARQEARPCA